MLWAFAPGMFVALLEGQIRWAARPMTLVIGIALLAAGLQSAWASVDVASGFGSFFVIAWAVERRPSLGIAAVPASIGAALTYSVYLWHVDLLKAIPSVPLALIAAVAIASLAYLLVERPFIRLGRHLARARPPRTRWRDHPARATSAGQPGGGQHGGRLARSVGRRCRSVPSAGCL